jgi:CrcB protein
MASVAGLAGVAVGGACGALLRHALGALVHRNFAPTSAFPWGTLAVNLVGCLAIGALAGLDLRGMPLPYGARLLIVVGLLGGFTTFSSFGIETFRMLHAGQFPSALLYVGLTNLAGLAAVALGFRIAGRL